MSDKLQERELTGRILGVFFEVYSELGHGFLESVYEDALAIAFTQVGLGFERQHLLSAWFRGHKLGEFKADIVVEGKVLLELKAGRGIERSHEAQLLNYLRCSDIEIGLLLNFGLSPQFRRLAFSNTRKRSLRVAKSEFLRNPKMTDAGEIRNKSAAGF
jgi:GxxExxY protein